jgi:hypothetical protein
MPLRHLPGEPGVIRIGIRQLPAQELCELHRRQLEVWKAARYLQHALFEKAGSPSGHRAAFRGHEDAPQNVE